MNSNFPCKPKSLAEIYRDKDPLLKLKKQKTKRNDNELPSFIPKIDSNVGMKIEPTISTRRGNEERPLIKAKYVVPVKKKEAERRFQHKKMLQDEVNKCRYQVMKFPSPPKIETLETKFDDRLEPPKIEPGQVKVLPEKPSSVMRAFPQPTPKDDLELKKPKSGIFINEKRHKRKKKKKAAAKEQIDDEEITFIKKPEDDDEVDLENVNGEGEDVGNLLDGDTIEFRKLRKKVYQISAATSYASVIGDDDDEKPKLSLSPPSENAARISVLGELVKKPSKILIEEKPPIRKQPKQKIILESFYFGSKQGTRYLTKNLGFCIPIAAYCYTFIKHPSDWSEKTIDRILNWGEELYNGLSGREPTPRTLPEYIKFGSKKIRFKLDEPEISGTIRSKDPTIMNLTKAFRLFFRYHKAGVLHTELTNYAIWKDKYFYFFDPEPRNQDLFSCAEGFAVLGIFYNMQELLTVLLERSNLGDLTFIMNEIHAFEVAKADKNDTDEHYRLAEDKAIVSAKYHLGDRYFGFGRFKQANVMSLICLIYSKITPLSAWTQTNVDKMMTVANRLHLDFAKLSGNTDYTLKLEEIPAVFRIGSYCVEIYIKQNLQGGLLNCDLLKDFFECHHNAMVEINNKYVIGLLTQRNLYYYFDPYARDSQGLISTKGGVACITMHKSIESLINMIEINFGTNQFCHIHSLKYCSIKRCPITPNIKRLAVEELNIPEGKICSMTKLDPNLPPLDTIMGNKIESRWELDEYADIADLDSASLTDTQIEPSIHSSDDNDYDSTDDEEEEEEDEDDDYEHEEGEEWYFARVTSTQIGSQSLLSGDLSDQTPLFTKEVLSPTKFVVPEIQFLCETRGDLMDPDELERLSQAADDWTKDSNFIEMPDGSQIIFGTKELLLNDSIENIEYVAPFVAIAATVVSKKFALQTWSSEIIDYVLTCGVALFENSNTRYDEVYRIEIPLISLGEDDFNVQIDYFLDAILKLQTLKNVLMKVLPKPLIFVTPNYSCAIFERHKLYYLFDCFGGNEVGLGTLRSAPVYLSRFQDLKSLIMRVYYNKTQRDPDFQRFVVSICNVNKLNEEDFDNMFPVFGEDDIPEEPPKNIVGYQDYNGIFKIQGSKGVDVNMNDPLKYLGEDYFVCLIACLKLLNNPIHRWDTRMVDYVVEEGKKYYLHAENIEINCKQTLRNVLVDQYFFDLVVRQISNFEYAKKTHFLLVQYPNRFNLYHYNEMGYHKFEPIDQAYWRMVPNINNIKQFQWYAFEITSFKKAPKQTLYEMEIGKKSKRKLFNKAFNEEISWLDLQPIPWSPKNKLPKVRWFNWVEIYPRDLFVLFGTLHQIRMGEEKYQNKQTLANLIVSLAMIKIYPLNQWSSKIVDVILENGNKYFEDSIANIIEENYELSLDDFKEPFRIEPLAFKLKFQPVADGTIFTVHQKCFNLYKALKYFFNGYRYRFGIITVCISQFREIPFHTKITKKHVAFGKYSDSEYFMFDCQTYCGPLFHTNEGVAYTLRTTSLNRLLHVLVLTLKGGDFFIFELNVKKI